MPGKVYVTGAGPGDPELLTLKARRVLSVADSVLYDNLANPAILRWARADAERVYVGKKRSEHAFSQHEIVQMLIERARRGLTVVRLKGGDPFMFGRGGEEAEGLVDAGIPFEVIPGVTSPLGIAAYSGVPLTHRDHTSVVTFITGHDVDGIDWNRTDLTGTVVVFMGLQHLAEIAERMIAAGRSPDTPAMAVRWGTRPEQVVVTGTLRTLAGTTSAANLHPPVTVVIGDVVALREKLSWFDKLPLRGQRIIITRAAVQASEFIDKLRELGADPIELSVIELAPLADYSELDARIRELELYDWIVFTSVNAVEYFLARLRTCDRDARSIHGRICAIGPGTRDALLTASLIADLVPDESVSEGVADAFRQLDMQGSRVLLPRAASAREVIPQALTHLGASVDVADAYRNIIPAEAEARIRTWRESGARADWIAFTSGSTVKNWLALAGHESLHGTKIASIGPATSDVARKHGLEVTVEADPHTIDGLISAILKST